MRRIEDAAMDRALYGVEETYHYHGNLVGRRRRYNERLVMFMLRNRAPHRFAEGGSRGLSAVDQLRLRRLRQEWRREWATEQQAARPNIDDVRTELLRKVALMEAHERQRWTPREHELHAALTAERAARKAREEREEREEREANERILARWRAPAREPDDAAPSDDRE